jgi:hypothetical protein
MQPGPGQSDHLERSQASSIRKAKPHPASAHWTSSRHTTSECRSAARSIRVWISTSSQNGSSRERSREPSEVRSMSGSVPPNSVSISTEPCGLVTRCRGRS